jgi:beta-lactam-binding protein with PASTA domain
VQTTPTVASSAASVAGGSCDSDEAVTDSQVTGSTVIGTSSASGHSIKEKTSPVIAQKVEDQSGKLMTMVTSDIKTLHNASDWMSPCKLPLKR